MKNKDEGITARGLKSFSLKKEVITLETAERRKKYFGWATVILWFGGGYYNVVIAGGEGGVFGTLLSVAALGCLSSWLFYRYEYYKAIKNKNKS